MADSKTKSKPVSKSHGRIYTPRYIVDIILDYVGYKDNILNKHVIDNSCGDGAFLSAIVERYCVCYLSQFNDLEKLKSDLENYVHGIEIDEEQTLLCKSNLNDVALRFGITEVNWNVISANTLCVRDFDGRMDYVVGNPPYVRVHNLESYYDLVKEFSFSQGGMTDLYIVFFEICFRMLNDRGKMSIITPSSWLTSLAGGVLRTHIKLFHNLSGAIDLGHYQAFNAMTYTLISRFDKNFNKSIDYKTYDGELHSVCDYLEYEDFFIGDKIYLSNSETLSMLRQIKLSKIASPLIKVKNGFATLADKVFIGDFDFPEHTIPVIKGSTGKWHTCVYPYNNIGKPLSLSEFEGSDAYNYLLQHKVVLEKGKRDSYWYCFGRSQAVADVWKHKYSINTVIKDKSSIKLNEIPVGAGVYSGLYILTDVPFKTIKEIIISDDFIAYVSSLKNYKSGGYYTFSTKDLELYINYKISEYE